MTRVAPEPTICVRQHHVVDSCPCCHRVLPRAVGGKAHGVGGHAVVGVAEGEDVVVARVQPGHEHGKVVRFTAAVDKVHHLQTFRFPQWQR